jgi:SAM-dependent methyltransferase
VGPEVNATGDKISLATVRADFNDPTAVLHYARAAHFLGLWASERILIQRFFPDTGAHLLEAGCGAGRVALGLWQLGYRDLTAFDFAAELLDQARSLARERAAEAIRFLPADATRLREGRAWRDLVPAGAAFDGALFMFNGLMQIPGRARRRAALRELRRACRPDAPLLFTTHDRHATAAEAELWRAEAGRWERGEQDPRLVEFGDRYFTDETGSTFMHLPDRAEILVDLDATGWEHTFDAMRREIAVESEAVREFSDDCRFWAARARAGGRAAPPSG